jgi:tetratricopeptide (TPR) repeat protein
MPESVREDGLQRESAIARLVDWVFGFDFFLSYSHGDGKCYPQGLKRRLEQAGFRVFLDQTEYVAGIDLRRETRRQVRKSRKLVVVGRTAALKSEWVRREVDVALADGKTPIIISVNRAVEDAPNGTDLASLAREWHWLRVHEQLADPDGEPSETTVSELVRGFNHTRQETKRQRFFATVAAILAIATGVALWQAFEAHRARLIAEEQRDRAQRVLDQVVGTANRRVQAISARAQKVNAVTNEAIDATPFGGSLLERANALLAQGSALLDRKEVDGARQHIESALALLKLSAGEKAGDAEWQLALFDAYDRLAGVAQESGDGELKLAALKSGLAVAKARGSKIEWRQNAARMQSGICDILRETRAFKDAETVCREAHAAWQMLDREFPNTPGIGQELAHILSLQGELASALGEVDASLDLYKGSLAVLDKLLSVGSAKQNIDGDRAIVLQRMVDALTSAKRFEEALKWVDRDVALSQALARDAGSDPRRLHDLASSFDRRAFVLGQLGRSAEAVESYQSGIQVLEGMTDNDTVETGWRRDAAAMLESAGKILGEVGQAERAIAAYRRALSIREGLAFSSQEPELQREMETAYRRASEFMLKLNRETDALETAEQYVLATSLTFDNSDGNFERTGRALGTLCWSAINARRYSRALWACGEAVKLAPSLDWIQLNYAHALMFSGERQKAQAIYLRGAKLKAEDAAKWNGSVREDFKTFRTRQLDDSFIDKILSLLGS